MRRVLAQLFYVAALGGCSLIYNPSNLPEQRGDGGPPIDAAVDAPLADANPALLMLSEVKSPPLLEGQGEGGSAPAILVVYGMNITKEATIAVAPATANPDVSLELGATSIADDGNSIAVLVTARVMPDVGEGAAIPLTVTVEQPGASPQTIAWSLQPLDELTTAGALAAPAADKLYARVNVTGNLAFTGGAGSAAALIRAVADITITGTVTANAPKLAANDMGAADLPGAGGCAGGAVNANGACAGGGKAGGGGAGYAMAGKSGASGAGGAMVGDALIPEYGDGSLPAHNRAAGGGGAGASGGGGGGTIELTAGGNLSVDSVEAKGAIGGAGGIGLVGGGGGAGGTVVLRAGGALALPAVAVNGGPGGSGLAGNGGAGADGRVRYDAASTTGAAPATARRAPMLVRPTNPLFEITKPNLMIAGTQGDRVDVIVVYADGSSQTIAQHLLTGPLTPVQPTLGIGLNKICVLVPGGTFGREEAQNCVSAAFIP